MVTNELLSFIRSELANGVSQPAITQELLGQGWKQADIDEAFATISGSSQSAPVSPQPSTEGASTNAPTDPSVYPTITIERIKDPNRFWAVPIIGGLVKFIILIPVFIEIYLLSIFAEFVAIGNSFVVLFTGKYWRFGYDYLLGVSRLEAKLLFYLTGLTNSYPGFSFEITDPYKIDIPYPEHPNRLFAIPIFGGLVRILMIIPFALWAGVVQYGSFLGAWLSTFPVLFTGTYPESFYELVKDGMRLQLAAGFYMFGFSDKYPSFKISWNHKVIKLILILLAAVYLIFSEGYSIMNSVNPHSSSSTDTSSSSSSFDFNPDKQFADANNVKRSSDVNAILNAVNEYSADHNSTLPSGITTTTKPINSSGANLCDALVKGNYIAALPVDPSISMNESVTDCSKPYDTGYTVVQLPGGSNRVTISAPHAELGKEISVTR